MSTITAKDLVEQDTDELTICPYCGDAPKYIDDWQGCCGESSAHFETHTIRYTATRHVNEFYRHKKEDYVFHNPETGQDFDEPCDETRIEE